MSSPVSRKSKRSPLHSPSKPTAEKIAPFRHPDFTDDQIQHLTENATSIRFIRTMRPFRQSERGLSLLETINSPRGDETTLSQDGDESPTLSSTDHELITLLMSRLVQLENRLAESNKQMIEKEKKIEMLEDKIRMLEKARDGKSSTGNVETNHQYRKLQRQVTEMEKFLNDYGMIWVGDTQKNTESENNNSSECKLKSEPVWKKPELPPPSYSSDKDFHIDYDLVVGNIKELNILAGDGLSQVDVSSGNARLKPTEPIPLTLYANGILMFSGPFRPFTDATTRDCIQDFMDGFYPSELQPLYPDGVPFKVSDKRHIVFKPEQIPFVGEGMNLYGDTVEINKKDEELSREYLPATTAGRPGNTKKFLEKLPEIVINSGKLFNIRDSVAQTLKANTRELQVKIVPTPISQKDGGDKGKNKLVSVRLRSENSTENFLLKLHVTNTIADICKYLDAFRPSATDYEIISLCPLKVYTNKNATLKECGFNSNVALYLRSIINR